MNFKDFLSKNKTVLIVSLIIIALIALYLIFIKRGNLIIKTTAPLSEIMVDGLPLDKEDVKVITGSEESNTDKILQIDIPKGKHNVSIIGENKLPYEEIITVPTVPIPEIVIIKLIPAMLQNSPTGSISEEGSSSLGYPTLGTSNNELIYLEGSANEIRKYDFNTPSIVFEEGDPIEIPDDFVTLLSLDISENDWITDLTYNSDKDSIIVKTENMETGEDTKYWLYTFDGSVKLNITGIYPSIIDIKWSGNKLIVVNENNEEYDVYAMDKNGANQRKVYESEFSNFGFNAASDLSYLVFQNHKNEKLNFNILTLPSGNNQLEISSSDFGGVTNISKDNSKIIYSYSSKGFSLFDRNGSVKKMANSHVLDEIFWLSNNEFIEFYMLDNYPNKMFFARYDGNGKQIKDYGAITFNPDDILIDSDGKVMYFNLSGTFFKVELDKL